MPPFLYCMITKWLTIEFAQVDHALRGDAYNAKSTTCYESIHTCYINDGTHYKNKLTCYAKTINQLLTIQN